MKITIYSFDKIKNSEYRTLINYYSKLTTKYIYLQQISLKSIEARKIILADLPKKIFSQPTLVLSEKGKEYSTQELIGLFNRYKNTGTHLNIIVGNSFGFEEEVYKQATLKLSLSKITMPHELAYIVLIEQLFRVFNSLARGKYNR